MAEPSSTQGLNATIEIQIGGVWYDLPGIADFSATGGEAPETDLATYGGVGRATGHARPPSVSVSIPIYQPHLEPWTLLRQDANRGKRLPYRLTTQEGEVVGDPGTTTVAVTVTSGAVVFVVASGPQTLKAWSPIPTSGGAWSSSRTLATRGTPSPGSLTI